MGFIKNREVNSTGIILEKAYHKIIGNPKISIVDEKSGIGDVTIAVYKDKTSRDNGAEPILTEKKSTLIDFQNEDIINPIQMLYNAVKILAEYQGYIDVFEDNQPI